MTNLREVKQIFRPLLERHGDIAVIGPRCLWIKPVRHVGLRFFVERTSHADFASPQWTIIDTFLLGRNLETTVGRYVWHYSRKATEFFDCWCWSDPDMIDDLTILIEKESLPFLRSIDTLEKYAEVYRRMFDRFNIEFPEDRLIVDIALGDLDAARKSCLELLPKYRENKHRDWWLYQNLRSKVVTVAEPLLDGDQQALAAILHGWEADNIRGTKIEPYWEPTPFPLETMDG